MQLSYARTGYFHPEAICAINEQHDHRSPKNTMPKNAMNKQPTLLIQTCLILATLIGISGCNRSLETTVHCESVNGYQSALGDLNIGNFSLGEIAMVDHGTKRVYRVYGVEPTAADLTSSNGTDTDKAPRYASFGFSTDKEIDAERKVGLQSLIDSNISIHLGAYRKTDIVPVDDLINRDPRINFDMENVLRQRKDVDFILVSSLTASDTTKVTLKNSTGTDPVVRTLQAPGYALTVHLDFVKTLQSADMKAGQFFNYIPVTIDPASHRIVTARDKKIDIGHYDQVPSKMYMAPGSK